MARKYVWWLARTEAVQRPDLVAVQVMEMGDYDDLCRFEAALGRAYYAADGTPLAPALLASLTPDELARCMLRLATEGERDPVRLHDGALRGLIPATAWREAG
jgi:hypothetical protein